MNYVNLDEGKLTYAKVENNVLLWANERGIIDFDAKRQRSPQILKTQTLKLVEEIGELADAVDADESKDALGDIMVVLTSIIWAIPSYKGQHFSLASAVAEARTKRRYWHWSTLFAHVGSLSAAVLKEKEPDIVFECCVNIITQLNKYVDKVMEKTSLLTCYRDAYKVIENRTGRTTVDGNFIKEGD